VLLATILLVAVRSVRYTQCRWAPEIARPDRFPHSQAEILPNIL
jgi:hypothetical protein